MAPVPTSSRYDVFESYFIIIVYPECFPFILEFAQASLKELKAVPCDTLLRDIDFQKSYWFNSSKQYTTMYREMKDNYSTEMLYLYLKDYFTNRLISTFLMWLSRLLDVI